MSAWQLISDQFPREQRRDAWRGALEKLNLPPTTCVSAAAQQRSDRKIATILTAGSAGGALREVLQRGLCGGEPDGTQMEHGLGQTLGLTRFPLRLIT